jgi:hypothetical protein
VDVHCAFLCALIDDSEEVFMQLDESLSTMARDWIPEVAEFIRDDGKLIERVDNVSIHVYSEHSSSILKET